jgi:hypothetical protein
MPMLTTSSEAFPASKKLMSDIPYVLRVASTLAALFAELSMYSGGRSFLPVMIPILLLHRHQIVQKLKLEQFRPEAVHFSRLLMYQGQWPELIWLQ